MLFKPLRRECNHFSRIYLLYSCIDTLLRLQIRLFDPCRSVSNPQLRSDVSGDCAVKDQSMHVSPTAA